MRPRKMRQGAISPQGPRARRFIFAGRARVFATGRGPKRRREQRIVGRPSRLFFRVGKSPFKFVRFFRHRSPVLRKIEINRSNGFIGNKHRHSLAFHGILSASIGSLAHSPVNERTWTSVPAVDGLQVLARAANDRQGSRGLVTTAPAIAQACAQPR